MRVVVADDAVILREGLARLLTEADFDVVGLAGDAEELFELVEQHRPDVAVVDIRMPPTHTDEGLRAAKAIRARWPHTGVLVLSQHVRASYALELLSDGTDGVGYLLKERVSDLAELASSVERIGNGGSALDPAVVEQLVGRPRRSDDALEHLTDREREVLALMAEGDPTRPSPSSCSSPSTRSRSTSRASWARCDFPSHQTITGGCWPCLPTSTPGKRVTLRQERIGYRVGPADPSGLLIWHDEIDAERPGMLVVHGGAGFDDDARRRRQVRRARGWRCSHPSPAAGACGTRRASRRSRREGGHLEPGRLGHDVGAEILCA